jgi:ABC-type transport system involved in multi-copper enzyme maturation permease subunit
MKFREIFRFEFAYQVRRAWPWLFFAVLIIFAFLMTRDGTLAEALYDDFFLNSPFAIAKTTVTGSLIWLLVAAAVAGEAAARDVATGMHPLTYTVPVSKAEYLGGRFLAAFVLNALILLAVQAGILLAVYSPGVDAALIGPFRPAAYLTAYAFLALPNAFVATAIQFSLAARSGRPMASYLGSVLLFFMSYVVGLFLLFQGRQDVANLLDPIGVHFILSDLSHLWTTIEKSWRLIELEGTVLTNRLLWLGIALGALTITGLRFRFAHRTESAWWRRWTRPFGRLRAGRRDAHSPEPALSERSESNGPAGIGGTAPALSTFAALSVNSTNVSTPISVAQAPREPALRSEATNGFGFAIHARQTLAIASISFRTIATSWAGLALLAAIPLMTVLVVLDQMELNGVPLVPTTARVINELTAPLSAELSRWVIIPLLIVFFAGELVWRERDAGLGEITDAMPGSEWAPFLGKFLGLGLVLVVFMALLTTAGMLAQVILGYHDFEIGLYLKILLGLQLPEYLLFALLALVIHVLVDQKYIGHLVAIIGYVFIALASMFGIEHNLLIYSAGPGWSYTEMRGFGPSLGPWLWFKLYWAAWALLLAVAARLLWVRGKERGLGVRLQLARRRFTRPTAWAAAAAVGLILALGGFIFYNTNVLNEYLTDSEITKLHAEYEQRYKRYERIPQPRMTATRLHVEIHPERREAQIRGSYSLLNHSAVAIDSIHVATVPGAEPEALAFDRTAALVLSDEDRGYRIYDLEKPLQPGDSLRLDFQVHIESRGFRNQGADASVVANGTYFTNGNWFPAIGYQQSRELIIARERREHGLPDRPVVPSLYDVEARKDRGRGIAFDAVVGTDADQVAVAPGALRRTWTEGGRRYFHYSTDGPIGNEYAFFSADYAVHEAKWNPSAGSGPAVTIQVFHHPGHTANLDRMLRSIRASLDYYTEHFGAYPRRYLSVVERPGEGTGMHADAGMITHEEGFAFWRPKDAGESLDLPFAVVAHEMAHQWTVPYAHVEGAPVMSESLAWYYGMKVVENARGREHLRRLLSFMRQPYPYPPIRRGEPLLRGLDPYLSYRKGPFALYALSEYIGEERVNGALRRLLEKHRPGEAPLATTLDLYRELQAVTPDSLQYLLHDLFEVNTYWVLETERVMAEQTQAGAWQVTLDVRARKLVADSAGVETVVPMDEMVQIGVFAPGADGDELGAPLYVQMHRIRSGEQTITVTAPHKPVLAGIDPYHLLDWEERGDDDNIEEVKLGS